MTASTQCAATAADVGRFRASPPTRRVYAPSPQDTPTCVPVDPALRDLLAAFDDGSRFDVDATRATLASFALAVGADDPGDLAEDGEVHGVPVRQYRPQASGPGPELVWFHGGGWVAGGVETADPLCRLLLERTGAPLTSVAYRLAPEHPFPAALDDAVTVVRALARIRPVAVGGDSVGGGLAAAACLVLRDEGLPLRGQLLLNPLLDATLSSPSVQELATGYGLTRTALQSFVRLYLDGADPHDPRASPLLADDLSGLPPAVVVTAEYDPLRDDGHRYADRLAQAGVPAAVRCFAAMVHGFVGMASVVPAADEASAWMVDELVRAAAD